MLRVDKKETFFVGQRMPIVYDLCNISNKTILSIVSNANVAIV